MSPSHHPRAGGSPGEAALLTTPPLPCSLFPRRNWRAPKCRSFAWRPTGPPRCLSASAAAPRSCPTTASRRTRSRSSAGCVGPRGWVGGAPTALPWPEDPGSYAGRAAAAPRPVPSPGNNDALQRAPLPASFGEAGS